MKNIQKKKLGLDLDTTLNTFEVNLLSRYNADYNHNLNKKDLTTWESHTIVKPECGIKLWDYLKEEGFFLNLGIQPHAQEVTKFLAEYYELHIATAYNDVNPYEKEEKTAWVRTHFPHIPVENIRFINNKGELDFDYLVDDGPHNIAAFKQKGILVDAAYNQTLTGVYHRVYDWLDIKKYFEEAI